MESGFESGVVSDWGSKLSCGVDLLDIFEGMSEGIFDLFKFFIYPKI